MYRYVNKIELEECLDKEIFHQQITADCFLGISSISDLLLILEDYKVDNISSDDVAKRLKKLRKNDDKIYISALTAERISCLLEDFEQYGYLCSQAKNPHTFVKELTFLKFNDNTFWDDELFEEACA